MIIDGTSQSGYDGLPVIEVRGPSTTSLWAGFVLDSGAVTIRGLSITRFYQGIQAPQNFSGQTIEHNFIGTNRSYVTNLGNSDGLFWRASASTIRNNVIAINAQGVTLSLGSGNTLEGNKIGMSLDGSAIVPNVGTGVAMSNGASDTLLKDNMISGNGNWGVDIAFIQGFPQVSNTIFRGNVIGLDAGGNDAGNAKGGVRANNAPGTRIGEPGQLRNVISGNGGPQPFDIGVGILVTGNPVPYPRIQNNYIGTDPSGLVARPNLNKGIDVDGPAVVGGSQPGEGNLISGHTDPGGGAGIIVGLAAGGSVIQGNTIGLNANGAVLGNGYSGITVRSTFGAMIGGTEPGARNVISGNGSYGISILKIVGADPPPAATGIHGNYIGTDATGTLARGNGQAGISVSGSLHQIGSPGGGANVIAFNGAQGISVNGNAGATRVAISHNSIKNNAGLGIDLGADGITPNDPGDIDAGVNNTQNFPVIVGASNKPWAQHGRDRRPLELRQRELSARVLCQRQLRPIRTRRR